MLPELSVETVAIAAIVIFSALVFYKSAQPKIDTSKLPPGPKPGWLIGNRIPSQYPWRYLESLTRQYGPVLTVWIGNSPLIVVGGYHAAYDLLERQGGATQSRPASFYASDIVSGGMRILLLPSGDRWRRLRKAIHTNLQPSQAVTFQPVQEKAAQNVLKDILANPDEHQDHVKRYAASVILNVAYGKPTATEIEDPEVQLVHLSASRLGAINKPGALMIDYFPWLKYIPLYLKKGKIWHQEELELFSRQLQGVRKKMAENTCDPCFGQHVLEKQREYGLNDDEAAYIAGSLFGAGSDTSASAITIGIMAGVMFPEKQALAQEELDRVVGRARPPNFNDWGDLPYVNAYCREIFRWRPVSSGGFAHMTTEDIPYGDYLIPKGVAIVGNHWSILRDPEVFPNPDAFEPERWLEPRRPDQKAWESTHNKSIRHSFTFGFGRRVCPGQHVAERSIFINLSLLLWSFNLRKKLDANGKEIDIDTLAFSNAANSHPLPGMPVKFEPRFEGVVDQINKLEGW